MFIFFPSATLIILAAERRWEGMVIILCVCMCVCMCLCVRMPVCKNLGKLQTLILLGSESSAMIISDYKAIIGVIIKHGITG